MDDLAELLKTMEPADVASMFAGARGSVPIYAGLYSKDASGPEELAFEARNRATSTAQRDAQYAAQMKAKGLAAIPDDALRKAVAARMQQEEQYPPALATRRADFAPQPRHEMRAFADGGGVHTDFTQPDMADGGSLIPDREYQKGGVVRSVISGVAKGAKTATKAPAAAKQISRDLMPSSLSIEKLAESLGVNVKEAPNVLSRRESTKNLREFLKPSAVQHRVFHGSNVPEGIVEDSQFAHYEPDQSDIHWLATDPNFADQYTYKYMEYPGEQGAIFPAHIQLKNPIEIPFDLNKRITPEVWKFAEDLGFSRSDFKEWLLENDIEKPKQAWRIIDSPQFREAAMDRGYDGIRAPEAGSETFGVFDRNRIKSQFNEGTYDTKTPDIGKKEGGSVEMRPFNKGGGVKKTLQQMADELLLRGVKTADKPDLARRSLFGLKAQPALDLPLARIEDIQKDVTKDMGKDLAKAPTVSEKSVEVNPATGSVKSTLQSVANAPMSRRAVLQTAAGQALRHAVPGLNDMLPGVGDVAKIIEPVAPASASVDMIPAFIMNAMRQGMSKDEAIKATMERFKLSQPHPMSDSFVMDPSHPVVDPMTGKPVPHSFQLDTLYDTLDDPMMAAADKEFIEPLRPSMALNNLLSPAQIDLSTPPLKMRGALRQMREADPERYRQLINQAKDYSTSTGEQAIESGMMTPRDLERFMRGVDENPKYRPEHLWNED